MRFIFFVFSLFSMLTMEARIGHSFPPGFTKICESPEIYVCDHFLSDAECNELIKIAGPSLQRSTVTNPNGSGGLIDPRRSSQGMFIPRNTKNKTVKNICERIANVTGIPQHHSEDIQVLHYDLGGEYQPHFDYFDPTIPGGKIQYDRGGQRVATLMVYLNTTIGGGETVFPLANLKITPIKGKAVLFYSVTPQGTPDPRSFHGGAVVTGGDKWIMTRWLRERTFK